MSDSIFRLEQRGDRVAVITKEWMDFADYRSPNPLTREHPDMFTSIGDISEDETTDTIRVGTAMHPDGEENFRIHGANGLYAEVPLIERELTDAEVEWCEETFMYGGENRPDTVVEFEIPNPEDLRAALLEQNLDVFSEVTARNPNHNTRHDILTTLQKSLEEQRFLQTKLSSRKGYPIDLEPEWDPDHAHNDDRDARALSDMAGMRSDSHHVDFETVVGFDYYTFFTARAAHLGIQESKLEYYELPALEVVGAPDWSYCRLCGGVLPEERFLHVQCRGYDDGKTMRVCDDCAEKDYGNHFDEDEVAIAKDDRARRRGGQRRLSGAYGDTDTNNDSDSAESCSEPEE